MRSGPGRRTAARAVVRGGVASRPALVLHVCFAQVGLDWTVDMADARSRLGNNVSVQGNVDPTILFASKVRALSRSAEPCVGSGQACGKRARALRRVAGVRGCGSPSDASQSCVAVAQDAIEVAVRDTLRKAGHKRHILNLGHGVLVGTPEESVAHMFQLSKEITYSSLLQHA